MEGAKNYLVPSAFTFRGTSDINEPDPILLLQLSEAQLFILPGIYLASHEVQIRHKVGFRVRLSCRKPTSSEAEAKIACFCRHFSSREPQVPSNKLNLQHLFRRKNKCCLVGRPGPLEVSSLILIYPARLYQISIFFFSLFALYSMKWAAKGQLWRIWWQLRVMVSKLLLFYFYFSNIWVESRVYIHSLLKILSCFEYRRVNLTL